MDYQGHAIRKSQSLGAAPHWHCDSLRLYGYPSEADLRAAIDAKLANMCNERGARDPQQAVEIHEESESAYRRL